MTSTLWGLIVVFLLVDLFVLPPLILRARLRPMDASARASAPGKFATLTDGITHYQWHGPKSGPIIVLVHGLSAPSFIFAGLIPYLTGAGYRVLTYDHFGRGWSDRPHNRQTGGFFAQQLNDLLDNQSVAQPVALVGYSMGGAVVSAYAHQYPNRVSQLVLLASGGFAHQTGGLINFIRYTPLIGDWLMAVFGAARLNNAAKLEDQSKSAVQDIVAKMQTETRYRGYLPAILSSLRHLLGRPLDQLHHDLAANNIPTLAIWGALDATIPIRSADRLSAANPKVKTVILADEGHSLTYTNPKDTAAEILAFLPAVSAHNSKA